MTATSPRLSVAHPTAIKAILLLASSLTVMSGATISPTLPSLQAHFADVANVDVWVRLILTAPALLIALASPLAGAIIDRFGRRRMILAATLLYGLAGASGLVLETVAGLMIGRALLGLAVAGVMTTASTLAGDYFTGAERDRFLGFQASFMAFGGVVFLLMGGILADLHWRAPFAVYALAFALIPAMSIWLYEPARAPRPSAAQAAQDARDAPVPVGLLALLYGLAVLHMVLFYALPVQLPFLLQEIGIPGGTAAGAALATATLVAAVVSLFFRNLMAIASHRAIFAISFGAMGLGLVILWQAESYAVVLLAMVTAGLGLGALMPNYMVILMARAPERVRGRAVGGLTTSIFLGQFVSPLITQPLATAFGLAPAFAAIGALSMAVAAVFVWLAWRGPSLVRPGER
ncbi:MAG: MFS transporter [Deinococcus-Thermus bacterium]|jgi:MFS family permease|nr:MFS transporter [Deinococcota bacterium]